MPDLVINETACTRCGLCAATCPSGVVTLSDVGLPRYTERGSELCIACGHCEAVCPSAALALSDPLLTPATCALGAAEIEPERLGAYLRMRRSIRLYRQEPVDRAAIERLMDIVRFAPTGHNRQDVHWLIIHETRELRRLTGMAVDWMRETAASGSPLAERFHMNARVYAWEQGRDSICRLAPHMVVAYVREGNPVALTNTVIALAHLEIIAPSFGLGTSWGGIFLQALNNYEPLREALELPFEHQAVHCMMFGYPEISFQRPPKRKPANIIWR